MTLTRWSSWALPLLALLMIGITLAPAEIWQAPVTDATYKGFDANFQYTTGGAGGTVTMSRDTVALTAVLGSRPTANLATTPLRKLNASVDVTVLKNNIGNQALRIGIWSPWTGTGYFVDFGASPANLITADAVTNGTVAANLADGKVISSTPLGKYRLGAVYGVALLVDRTAGFITARLSNSNGPAAEAVMSSRTFPAIFGNVQMSLTATASTLGPPVNATLQNFVLTLPHERLWAAKASDRMVTTALIVLALGGGLLVVVALITAVRPGQVMKLRLRRPRWTWLLVICAIVAYLGGNALLLPLAGHPFDFGNEELYAYVAKAYGPDQLYYLPNVVSLAKIWGGIPYNEAAFPYGPVVAYLFDGIGWVTSVVFAAGGLFSRDSVHVAYVIKTVNVLFGLGDSALIYLILREIKVTKKWSLIASGLFLFNPAVWFSMSVWGQTHVMSLFFVLAAVWFAERQLPLWAWLALATACLTRPQMLVFGLLLGIVFLRKFTWRENVSALSWTVILCFLSWIPLTLVTSPSLPVDIMLNNFRVQEAGGNQSVLTTVSQDAYSLWPLVTYIVHGASGLQRAFTASSTPLVGSVTYQQVSQIVTVAAILLVSVALAVRKRAELELGGYLPLIALGFTSFLMLLTGLVATHFLLALPFLLLCRRWMGTVAYFYVAAIWTVTTLIPMTGEMAILLPHQQYPLLPGGSNAINQFVIALYSSDRFITVAVIGNICAIIWLTFRSVLPTHVPARAAAVGS